MKNSLFVLVLSLFVLSSITANNGVPLIVRTSFTALYPSIKAPFWEVKNDQVVALFNDQEGMKKVFFQKNGDWMETRHRLSVAQLPTALKDFVEENYATAEITFAGKITSETGSWYRIESEFEDRIVLKDLEASGVLISQEEINFSFQNIVPSRLPNMFPKLLPIRLIHPIQ